MIRKLLLAAALLSPVLARAESPQHVAVEIKFGPYFPDLDSSPGLTEPVFSDLLGASDAVRRQKPPWALLSQVEVDYQFFHRFGSLGVGVSGGYFRKTAPQLLYFNTANGFKTCSIHTFPRDIDKVTYHFKKYVLPGSDPEVAQDSPDACLSNDENILNIVPLSVMLVYRFDYLSKRWRFPLIPYVKVGLAYYLWWFGSTSSFVVREEVDKDGVKLKDDVTGATGSGGTFGFVLHPGLAIDLGTIDRQAAAIMDKEIGLNRVSAFVELNYARINNFGSEAATTLDLSDTALNAGLSFEF